VSNFKHYLASWMVQLCFPTNYRSQIKNSLLQFQPPNCIILSERSQLISDINMHETVQRDKEEITPFVRAFSSSSFSFCRTSWSFCDNFSRSRRMVRPSIFGEIFLVRVLGNNASTVSNSEQISKQRRFRYGGVAPEYTGGSVSRHTFIG